MTIKVLVSEDHELYRDGLGLLLREAFFGVQIIESGDFATTKNCLTDHQDIALVLFDIHIPGTSGLEGLKEVKALYPALPLVVVSTIDRQASIEQMLQLGADGFIAKTSSKTVMVQALQDIMKGERVIISGQENTETIVLSPRQLDVLKYLSLGMPNKDIASTLKITHATVREHVSAILALFSCENRTQVVLKARRLGFILD